MSRERARPARHVARSWALLLGVMPFLALVGGTMAGGTLAGCRSTGSAADDTDTPIVTTLRDIDPDAITLATIVWRETGRDPAPDYFERALASEDPTLRAAAARALGRIQAPGSIPLLLSAATDEAEVTVLMEIAFAIGQIQGQLHEPDAFATLKRMAQHEERAVRLRAIDAVGKLAGRALQPTASLLVRSLADPDAGVRGASALALWRRDVRHAIPHLAGRLEAAEKPEVRWRAAYALMRIEDPATLPHLRARLQDVHPWVRTFAAWGLRNPLDPQAVEPLAQMLADPVCPWTARVQALWTLKELRARKVGDQDRIREVLVDRAGFEQHPQVTLALIEALAEQGGRVERAVLERMISAPNSATAQRGALVALAQIAGDEAIPMLREHLRHDDPWTRAAAARGLGYCGAGAVESLCACLDAENELDVRVRAASVDGLGRIATLESWRPVREVAARDRDTAVRGTAIKKLAEGKPQGWQAILARVYGESSGHAHVELRQIILRSLEGEEALPPLLETALRDPAPGVRFTALQLADREEIAPTRARFESPYPMLEPPRIPGAALPRLTLETQRGPVVIELFLRDAPRHVSNIVYLARKGFYDGLGFHRVVPSFVVQGGDPRGDSWGDAGYSLPDEINPHPYLRGTLGMPKFSKDDGGCQIFITHLPTPHLDGRYTVFGQVVEGLDVIDRLEVGDTITRAFVSGLPADH